MRQITTFNVGKIYWAHELDISHLDCIYVEAACINKTKFS